MNLSESVVGVRVRGLVQGVGFRPTVWRLASASGLRGDVRNDGAGVLIRVRQAGEGDVLALEAFLARLRSECPPLARIDTIEPCALTDPNDLAGFCPDAGFRILESGAGEIRTGIVADAATCEDCLAELVDPDDRRHRYPFINCTHCGPRLSIVAGIPYDRALTSMAGFPMCPACLAEYRNPGDRRFHAQPNACPVCGPRVWLADAQGRRLALDVQAPDAAIVAASRCLASGGIVAVKGIGGFHLACDATNAGAVAELRRRKRRFGKPFALMARDLEVIRRYCRVSEQEARLLVQPAAPIVLLEQIEDWRVTSGPSRGSDPAQVIGPARAPSSRAVQESLGSSDRTAPTAAFPVLASDVAPGQTTLGFMLPYSPIHHLLLADWDRPLVMTSGNLSEEPQCTDNEEAVGRLGSLADQLLLHDRPILNRLDDSVVRIMAGAPRLLRRARGLAPTPLALPPGFAQAPPVLAMGGELKSSFCLLRDGQAILSQHLGDLEDARTAREYARTLALYVDLFRMKPECLAVDTHPDYRSAVIGRAWAQRDGLPLIGVQHHHAHLASVLVENDWPLDGGATLGVLLDGLGYGSDGTLWGGEVLVGDYQTFTRVAHLKPVAMPGGTRAILEPWRNLYAQLESAGGLTRWRDTHPAIATLARLEAKPLGTLRRAIERGVNAPLSSSAGRLFDAVAAVLGVAFDRVSYEGQAAIELESLAWRGMERAGEGYPFGCVASPGTGCSAAAESVSDAIERRPGTCAAERVRGAGADLALRLDPAPMWEMLLEDLEQGRPREEIAAAFHLGFARALALLVSELARRHGLGSVALSGGVFQNRLMLESLTGALTRKGMRVLLQSKVPSNDGGLALGQAAVAAARILAAPG